MSIVGIASILFSVLNGIHRGQQEFSALGQALQAGNLQSARSAFASLQEDLQQFGPSDNSSSLFGSSTSSTTSSSSSTQIASGTLNVTV
jgi:hypothetical protein